MGQAVVSMASLGRSHRPQHTCPGVRGGWGEELGEAGLGSRGSRESHGAFTVKGLMNPELWVPRKHLPGLTCRAQVLTTGTRAAGFRAS